MYKLLLFNGYNLYINVSIFTTFKSLYLRAILTFYFFKYLCSSLHSLVTLVNRAPIIYKGVLIHGLLKGMAPAFPSLLGDVEVNNMNINRTYIEQITGERLRQLPLCEEDIYSIEGIEWMEEDDEISALEGGFMIGYVEDIHR